MKKIALMFPGQGSQTVGMSKDLYDHYDLVKSLFETANDVLGFNMKQLMFEGPQEKLTETENAQPALLLSSVAAFKLLEKQGVAPSMVVGHSLGEYSALVAAGAIDVEEALPLVQKRGQLMEEAYPSGQGTMAAVLGMDAAAINAVLSDVSDEETAQIANLNCPGQIVISGSKQGVEEASEKLKSAGAKRVIPLNVSGPFHSRLMAPASKVFSETLNKISFSNAQVPVYANVTAQAVKDADTIKNLLIEQLYSPVRFHESVENIIDENIDAIVEVGTGKVLSGLVKKINRRTKTFQVNDQASFEKFMHWFKEEDE